VTHRHAGRLALAATTIDVVGAAVAIRHDLPGEPLGIRLPPSIPRPVELALWGTAVSAPFVTDAGLAILAAADVRRHPAAAAAITALGILRLAGLAAEPATWGRRRPRSAVLLSAAHVPLALAIARAGRRSG
jgi:hypothetical protein